MTTHVPTERVIIRPETQGVYEPGVGGRKMIKFFIPPSVGFIDTVDLVLRSTITMSSADGDAKGYARPNPKAGIGSLFRSLSIRSGSNNALIEHIDSWNGLCAATLNYSDNESIGAMRALTEGVDVGSPGYDTAPLNSIYYTTTASAAAAGGVEPRKVMTEYPFHHSGILSGGKTFPVKATGGLRVELQLDDVNRSLLPYRIAGLAPPAVRTLADINSNTWAATGDEHAVVTANVVAPGYGYEFFRRGDTCRIQYAAAPAAQYLEFTVNNIQVDANDRLMLYLELTSMPPANVLIPANTAIELTTAAFQQSYTLEDLALVFNKVTPDAGYQSALMKRVGSAEGKKIDFRTFSLIRNTLPTMNGVISQNIPTVHPEAYSILSIPYDADKYSTMEDDTFKPDFDGAVSYQYFIDGEAVPNRAVSLARLAGDEPIPEALHLREMTKALENAKVTVRNLIQCQTRSFIGRALSVQNQVADLANGDTRLQTEYANAGTTKQFDHHIQFCAEMTIADNVVTIRR